MSGADSDLNTGHGKSAQTEGVEDVVDGIDMVDIGQIVVPVTQNKEEHQQSDQSGYCHIGAVDKGGGRKATQKDIPEDAAAGGGYHTQRHNAE